MCGIAGMIWSEPERLADAEPLEAALTAIWRRGPDGQGVLIRPGITAGMRRLAIIDLEGGQQPIFNETGDVGVLFNGEIYSTRPVSSLTTRSRVTVLSGTSSSQPSRKAAPSARISDAKYPSAPEIAGRYLPLVKLGREKPPSGRTAAPKGGLPSIPSSVTRIEPFGLAAGFFSRTVPETRGVGRKDSLTSMSEPFTSIDCCPSNGEFPPVPIQRSW